MTEHDTFLKLKELTGRLEELEDFLMKYKKLTEQCTNELGIDVKAQDVTEDGINQT